MHFEMRILSVKYIDRASILSMTQTHVEFRQRYVFTIILLCFSK